MIVVVAEDYFCHHKNVIKIKGTDEDSPSQRENADLFREPGSQAVSPGRLPSRNSLLSRMVKRELQDLSCKFRNTCDLHLKSNGRLQ